MAIQGLSSWLKSWLGNRCAAADIYAGIEYAGFNCTDGGSGRPDAAAQAPRHARTIAATTQTAEDRPDKARLAKRFSEFRAAG